MAFINGEWVSDFGNLGGFSLDGTGGTLSSPITADSINAASYKGYVPAPTTGVTSPSSTNMFGDIGLGDLAGVAEGLGSLGGAYTAYKGLGQAEDQFNFEKALANRNLANEGLLINTQIQNAADVGLALGGGAMTPEQIEASKAATATRFVDTSAIG